MKTQIILQCVQYGLIFMGKNYTKVNSDHV